MEFHRFEKNFGVDFWLLFLIKLKLPGLLFDHSAAEILQKRRPPAGKGRSLRLRCGGSLFGGSRPLTAQKGSSSRKRSKSEVRSRGTPFLEVPGR